MLTIELLESALRGLRAIDPDESATPKELEDALLAFNAMMAFWGTQRFGNSVQQRDSYAWPASTASVAIGTGQTFDTALPSKIVSAYARLDGIDYPLEVKAQDQFAAIQQKSLGSVPCEIYLEKTTDVSGTLYLWPVPQTGYTVFTESYKPLGPYTLMQDLGLPPEVIMAAKWNLMLEIAPEFGGEPSQSIVFMANSTLNTLKAMRSYPAKAVKTDVIGTNRRLPNIYGGIR